jgi:Fe-S-cluster containining protein
MKFFKSYGKMPIKQLIPQEFCLKCPGCCRFSREESVWSPHLLAEEKTKLGDIKIVENPGQDNFVCSHLRASDNKCAIYADRPFECRLYPYLFNRKENRFFLALDLNCPFVSQNRDSPEFREYSRELIALVQTPLYLDIFRANPQLFQEYDGVFDLVELRV